MYLHICVCSLRQTSCDFCVYKSFFMEVHNIMDCTGCIGVLLWCDIAIFYVKLKIWVLLPLMSESDSCENFPGGFRKNSFFTFSAAHDAVGSLTKLSALGIAHVTRPGELAQLPEPAVLADAASTWTVTVTWQWRAEGPSFKGDRIWSTAMRKSTNRGKK